MSHIDLKYRPISYFWAADKGIHLSSNIMGAERKAMYEHLVAVGKTELIDDWIASPVLSAEDRARIGRSHPAFMGGVTCPGKSGPPVVRISTWHLGEGHAKEEDLTREDHFAAAAD